MDLLDDEIGRLSVMEWGPGAPPYPDGDTEQSADDQLVVVGLPIRPIHDITPEVPEDDDEITDHVAQALALFVHQYRDVRVRVISTDDTIYYPELLVIPTVVPEDDDEITDYVGDARSLFVEQYQGVREFA